MKGVICTAAKCTFTLFYESVIVSDDSTGIEKLLLNLFLHIELYTLNTVKGGLI